MSISLQGAEIECAKRLAKWFEEGKDWVTKDVDALGLTLQNCDQVLATMELAGIISGAIHSTGGQFDMFRITPRALQAARQIEEQTKKNTEAKDIVESVKLTLRRHPVAGWVFVAFVALGGVLTFANQALTFLKHVGLIQESVRTPAVTPPPAAPANPHPTPEIPPS